jgi:hypothetical protein
MDVGHGDAAVDDGADNGVDDEDEAGCDAAMAYMLIMSRGSAENG